MAKETIDILVEGGKATAAPPLGPALGPLGVNIGQVVSEINKKTGDFKGMKVPVKVTVDRDTKAFSISIGTPPASALIKKEAGLDKGAQRAGSENVADLKIEQIIKIAKMKHDSLTGKDSIKKSREIIGTCKSMGILVEGKDPSEIFRRMDNGEFVEKIIKGKTELSAEELRELAEEKKRLREELEAKRATFERKAKEIIAQMTGKERKEIKKALIEAEIPAQLIEELLPAEEKKEEKPQEKKS